MERELEDLKTRLQEIYDLNSASAVLSWDQATYMPPGGAAARSRQMATLSQLSQEKFTDAAVGHLLDALEKQIDALPEDDAALVRATRRNYDRLVKVPPQLVAKITNHSAMAYQTWTQARPANDFAAVAPYLEKSVAYAREVADCFPGYDHIADPLIDWSDYGMKAATVKALFADLRAQLVPLVEAVTAQESADTSCLQQFFPQDKQRAFGEKIIRQFGYDFDRGRQDLTHHPFATKFSIGDVRITTRFDEHNLGDGLFSTLHESGHAMYEQGVDPGYEGTPLDGGTSAGVHESQSRTWENLVGRSRAFWTHYYPELQATFPEQLNTVSLDTFYRAVNSVKRSLIRVDADQLTYDLHVMIRFDLELALLEGSLSIQDLPEAWHARYEADLGVHAPSDIDGVLQDVHWYGGLVGGAFQGYTLGNIMSAAFYDRALADHPTIPDEIGQGEFGTLHGWLKENIYQYGSKYTAPELIERVLGAPLTIDPYIAYLKSKFGELYAL